MAATAVKRSAVAPANKSSEKKQKPSGPVPVPECTEKMPGLCLGSDDIGNMVQCTDCHKWVCWDCSTEAPGWKDGYCEACETSSCCRKNVYCTRCDAGHCSRCAANCSDCDLRGTIDCTGGREYECARCHKGACQACYETEDWCEHFCELCQKVYCCETLESCDGCERQRCEGCGKTCCGGGGDDDGDSSDSPNENDDE